jgi:hypothetical protein
MMPALASQGGDATKVLAYRSIGTRCPAGETDIQLSSQTFPGSELSGEDRGTGSWDHGCPTSV